MHLDPEALDASLRMLSHPPREADLQRALGKVVTAVHRLFDCDGAGLMFADGNGVLRYVTATDETGRRLEVSQAELGEGPCVDAYVHGKVVACRDVTEDSRWPALAAVLQNGDGPQGTGAPHGAVRGMMGAPVRLSGTPIGCLNLHAHGPREWDESDLHGLPAYAELIEETIAAALAAEHTSSLARQLEYALRNRVMIERAVGFLMADRGLDSSQAFDHLRGRARSSRRRTVHVAAELLGEELPKEADRPPVS
ncbi:GAF and ANTAR domain-containing protein [Spirillospora sp. NPDC047279]|uniref:GAF and ANTAR domain-containing protein n=1 Tax=Spirillospora sp. NPDC047279 TaxID=3155478 RepID=UPI0033F582EB